MAECANGRETGAEEALVALKGKDVAELRAMAQRLERGQESLQEMLKELEAEREELHKEKAQLNDTISLFMKDLQKLHIGAQNTVEPVLEEGPLDFVGRFWETVKPRDSAYMAGENIGEIRKPGDKADKPPNAPLAALQQVQQELPHSMQEVQDMGRQAARKLSTAFEEARSSAWWQKAQGYLDEKRTEIAKKVSEVQANAQAAAQASSMPPRRPRRQPAEPKASAPAPEHAEPATNGGPSSASDGPQAASPTAAEPAPKETAAPSLPAEKSEEKSPKREAEKPAQKSAAKPAETPAEKSPEKQADPSPTSASPSADRQETILVEAQVKIGDGSVQPLHVRASDRCKDAAERFVAEHSLKASFVKPLTDFLKKVERDADTFPVHVEVDIMELGPGH